MVNKKNTERLNKDFMIRVRVTTVEHEEFVKRAKENGYKSVSEFIRSLISEKSESEKSVS